MSIIIMQDGFQCDSSGWRPKAPKDVYEITVQVVQRYDEGKPDPKKLKPRRPSIELDLTHTAEDTKASFGGVVPLTPDSARKLAAILTEAATVAEKEDRTTPSGAKEGGSNG